MRNLGFLIALAFFPLISCEKRTSTRPASPTDGSKRYQSVMALPDGITVTHSPQEVYAEERSSNEYRYTWRYEVSVESIQGDLKIIEYGLFVGEHGYWIFSPIAPEPLSSEIFAEKFSCSDAQLIGGERYTAKHEWIGASALIDQIHLWYFIGEDSEGNRFKGTARLDTVAALKSEQDAAVKIQQ